MSDKNTLVVVAVIGLGLWALSQVKEPTPEPVPPETPTNPDVGASLTIK